LTSLSSICCIAVDGRSDSTNRVDLLCNLASKMRHLMNMGDAVILSAKPPSKDYPGVRVILINALNYNEYSMVAFNQLHRFTDKEHLMVFQDDGFITRPDLWTDEFLQYDYIGAPWSHSYSWSGPDRDVGNGGFSIRSRRLSEMCSALPFINGAHEDGLICYHYRDYLISNGIRFAPLSLAYRFSIENPFDSNHSIENTFGFHGKQHVEMGMKMLFRKEV
jgi:hypothetical protein